MQQNLNLKNTTGADTSKLAKKTDLSFSKLMLLKRLCMIN